MRAIVYMGIVVTLLTGCNKSDSVHSIEKQEIKNSSIEPQQLLELSIDDMQDELSEFTGNATFEADLPDTYQDSTNPLDLFGNNLPGLKDLIKDNVLNPDHSYYIYPSRLRVRSGPSGDHEILGVLNQNDRVTLETGEIIGEYIQVKSFETSSSIKTSETYYIGYKYLSTEKSKSRTTNAKYFMIQNIATEILRVYEKKCNDGQCGHRLILETDIAVGEPETNETAAGYYHITSWTKFYQDGAGLYPSWYHPSYPMPPKPDSSPRTWTKSKYLPYKGASMRGAFGWFTAKVGPRSHYQWTHGTIGWGVDKKEYIEATRGFWANLFVDPRSHGCTRTDNESIAYIRHLLPVGTPLIKVYAKEAYGDPSRSEYNEYQADWDYILTKNGSRTNGEEADRQIVLNNRTPRSQWLEEGTFKIDAHPDAEVFLTGSSGAKSGKNGNVYGYNHEDMRGVFLIDKGLLINYQHPRKVKVGGYTDQLMPSFVRASASTYFEMPECPIDHRKLRNISSHKRRKAGFEPPYVRRCSPDKPF